MQTFRGLIAVGGSTTRMEEIGVILALYSVFASVVLVWSTQLDEGRVLAAQMSRGGVEFVAIPDQSFLELAEQHPNLVFFDLHTDRVVSGWSRFISSWLPISVSDLPNVLKWLPPASSVVFCCKDATEQLDTHTKTILVQLGIGTVYFLTNKHVIEGNRWFDPEIRARDADREPGKITITEMGRRL